MKQTFWNAKDVHESLASQVVNCWKAPPDNFFKANANAALDITRGVIGLGIVIRDNNGNFLAGKTEARNGDKDPHTAELLAAREGLLFA